MEGIVVERGHEGFDIIHILQGGGGGHIAAIQQRVHAHIGHTLLLGVGNQRLEVGDVAVHVAIRQQADEVQGGFIGYAPAGQGLPGGGFKQLAAFDGFVYQLCALRVDLAAAQGVVAHLAVAHILIGGQTHGRAVRLNGVVGAGAHHFVQGGGVGVHHHVAKILVGLAHAVHDHEHNGLFIHNRFISFPI